MATKKFSVVWTVECEIELDDEVIDRVDDEWRKHLYNLHGAAEIAEHIAYNIVMNNNGLSRLDGWADMEDSKAKVTSENIFDFEAQPIESDGG